jgi:hypothetical protein
MKILKKFREDPNLETLLDFFEEKELNPRIDETLGIPSINIQVSPIRSNTEDIFGKFPVKFVEGVAEVNKEKIRLMDYSTSDLGEYVERFKKTRGVYPGYVIAAVKIGNKDVYVGIGNPEIYKDNI